MWILKHERSDNFAEEIFPRLYNELPPVIKNSQIVKWNIIKIKICIKYILNL